MCYGILCPGQYEPSKDVFNAAQSGAMIPNLVSHEFRYLLDQLKYVCTYNAPVGNCGTYQYDAM